MLSALHIEQDSILDVADFIEIHFATITKIKQKMRWCIESFLIKSINFNFYILLLPLLYSFSLETRIIF